VEKPKFNTGTRVKFIKGGRRGRVGIVMGVVRGCRFEAYKVGLTGQWDDPYDQQHWLHIRADFLDYESVIDKLGDVLDKDDLAHA
jgi:hypothetical protein